MFKKILALLIVGIFTLVLSELSFAEGCGMHSSQQQKAGATVQATQQKTIEAGNKICPVTGEKISEETKATYEYQGKIYNFCCAACIDEFKKDPQKYIKKIQEEKKEAESEIEPQGHEGHHH
ncbi:MAG: YHS domain-containing protein [Candidatus Omnitrophota bacterium]|nr:YHS domain-containing protein [Candidatus Omnitrophota bacterium]